MIKKIIINTAATKAGGKPLSELGTKNFFRTLLAGVENVVEDSSLTAPSVDSPQVIDITDTTNNNSPDAVDGSQQNTAQTGEVQPPQPEDSSVHDLPILDTSSPSSESAQNQQKDESQNQNVQATQPCQGNSTDDCIAVEYTVPASTIEETPTDKGQLVTISAKDETVPLVDVLAYTTIPKIYKVGQEDKIKIKWKNNGNQDVQFTAKDLNGDGYLDYVEWTVPHLSDQTFEIIFISKAFQLDADKNIIADIYDQVKDKDDDWAQISNGQYIRATFDSPLGSTNDNTIYGMLMISDKKIRKRPIRRESILFLCPRAYTI